MLWNPTRLSRHFPNLIPFGMMLGQLWGHPPWEICYCSIDFPNLHLALSYYLPSIPVGRQVVLIAFCILLNSAGFSAMQMPSTFISGTYQSIIFIVFAHKIIIIIRHSGAISFEIYNKLIKFQQEFFKNKWLISAQTKEFFRLSSSGVARCLLL